MKTVSAGGIVVNENGQVALVFEEDFQGWVFPKGHLEKGETIQETALREIREETGLEKFQQKCYLGTIKREEFGTGNQKTIHIFLYKSKNEQLKCGKWFDISSALKSLHYKEERIFLENNEKDIQI